MTITKEQFNKLVTKKEHKKLEGKVDKIDGRVVKLEGKVDKLDKKVDKLYVEQLSIKEDVKKCATKDEMNEKFDEVLGAVDKVFKKLDDMEHAFVSNLAAHDRFEKRLLRIEKQLELEPMFS